MCNDDVYKISVASCIYEYTRELTENVMNENNNWKSMGKSPNFKEFLFPKYCRFDEKYK